MTAPRAIFKGENESVKVGLWVTDGTEAGTTEIKVAKASPLGLFHSTIAPPDFTVLGKKVLFEGFAEGGSFLGRLGLWVTDGTSAGTSELSSIVGAHAGGIIGGYPDFAVLGAERCSKAST